MPTAVIYPRDAAEVAGGAGSPRSGCVGDAGTVARLGADEFAILLLTGCPVEVARLSGRVAAAVNDPVPPGAGGATEVRVRATPTA